MENNKILYEAIYHRKSVRKYAPDSADQTLQKQILDIIRDLPCPSPDSKCAFRALDAHQAKGMSTFAPQYIALYAEKTPDALINAAFKLQQIDLWLSSMGYGACWLGMPRPVAGMESADGLPYAIMLGFGKPLGDPHREVSGFSRKALSEITSITSMDDLLEAVRIAPSATNRQPWFLTQDGKTIRLFTAQANPLMQKLYGNMPLIDMGIALCHLWLSCVSKGCFDGFARETKPETPKGYEYAWSIRLK